MRVSVCHCAATFSISSIFYYSVVQQNLGVIMTDYLLWKLYYYSLLFTFYKQAVLLGITWYLQLVDCKITGDNIQRCYCQDHSYHRDLYRTRDYARKLAKRRRIQQAQSGIVLLIIIGFICGGVLGALLFQQFQFYALSVPAGICLTLATSYRLYKRKTAPLRT